MQESHLAFQRGRVGSVVAQPVAMQDRGDVEKELHSSQVLTGADSRTCHGHKLYDNYVVVLCPVLLAFGQGTLRFSRYETG